MANETQYLFLMWEWIETHLLLQTWKWIQKEPAVFTSMVISSFTFFAVALQARAAWVQNRQSVRPYVHVGMALQSDGKHHIICAVLENAGLGPAIIEDYYVEYKGKAYRDSQVIDLFDGIFEECDSYVLRPGAAIPIKDKIKILGIKITEKNLQYGDIQKYLHDNFTLVVKHKSLLDERKVYRSDHEWPMDIQQELECQPESAQNQTLPLSKTG